MPTEPQKDPNTAQPTAGQQAPQTAPPAAPAATPSPEEKKSEESFKSHLTDIAKSFDMVIEPEAGPEKKEAAPKTPPAAPSDDRPPAAMPASTPPPAEGTPPARRLKFKQSTADALAAKIPPKQETVAAQPPPQPPAASPSPPAAEKKEPDDSALTDEQRDAVAFAKFAEERFPQYKGKAAETRAFFSKLDKYISENPETNPDSDEFRDFVSKNQPKFKEGDRFRIQSAMIEDRAAEKVRNEIEPKLEQERQATQRKLREVEARPVVERELNKFNSNLITGAKLDLPQGLEKIDPEAFEIMKTKGVEEAARAYPVEIPIIRRTEAAAFQYLRIAKGEVDFDPKNETHMWLGQFVGNQCDIFKRNAPKEHRVRDGRTFATRVEYAQAIQQDPSASSKYWTFSDDEILEMLAINAHIASSLQLKHLESAGFKREKSRKSGNSAGSETSAAAQTQSNPPTNPPRGGGNAMPGAADAGGTEPSHMANFFESLGPGLSKLAGVK